LIDVATEQREDISLRVLIVHQWSLGTVIFCAIRLTVALLALYLGV
jgi:hypothetical protein